MMTGENADENSTAQRTALLIVFGMMFTTVGLAIGGADSYGVLSFVFLGLGLVLSFIAAVLEVGENDAGGEKK